MNKRNARIAVSLVLAMCGLLALQVSMTKPKAATAEQFPSVNLGCVDCPDETQDDTNGNIVKLEPVYADSNANTKETEKTKDNPLTDESPAEDMVVTACSHKWNTTQVSATCCTEGYTKHTCELCGEINTTVIPCTAHVEGEWKITVEPTEYADGVRLKDCIYCDIILRFENFRQIVKTIFIQQALECTLKWLIRNKKRRVQDASFSYASLSVNSTSYSNVPVHVPNATVRFSIVTGALILNGEISLPTCVIPANITPTSIVCSL